MKFWLGKTNDTFHKEKTKIMFQYGGLAIYGCQQGVCIIICITGRFIHYFISYHIWWQIQRVFTCLNRGNLQGTAVWLYPHLIRFGSLCNSAIGGNKVTINIKINIYQQKKGHPTMVEVRPWMNILSWCWWDLVTSANQIAQNGSCDRSRIHNHDLGGTGVWPGKK